MNPVLLIWKKRVTYLWKLYYKFISFQIDGVILIYSLGLVGVLGLYFKETILEIMRYVPADYMAILLQVILMLFLAWGNLTGHLKLADQVFLSPLDIDGKKFLKYSHTLSKGIHILIWFFIWTILYLYYRINFDATIYIYLTVLICGAILKIAVLNFKFIIWNKLGKWRRRIYNALFYLVAYGFIGRALSILTQSYISKIKLIIYFSSSTIILIISQLIKNDILIDWERLINEETNKRVRNFAFLLGQPYREKKSSRRRTISVFSGRKILPFNEKGALLLLYFKILQRGEGNLVLLLQMYFGILASIIFGGQLVSSSGIAEIRTFAIISNIFVAYILAGFLSSLWINLKEDIWFRVYPYTLKQKMDAIELAPTIVLIIVLLFINIPLNLVNKWIFNPAISFIGIIIVSIITVKIHSYLLMSKLEIY